MSKEKNSAERIQIKAAIITGIFTILAALIAGIFLLLSKGNSAPMSTNEPSNQVTVPANLAWMDTGFDISSGNRLIIESAGYTYLWGGTPVSGSDSNGQSNRYCIDPTCIIEGIEYGTLVGRIGNNPPFRVGLKLEFVSQYSGRLFLVVNDNQGYFDDNIGDLAVTIYRK